MYNSQDHRVLFLGIGNYCASRFAEIIFNQWACDHLHHFQGISRGVFLKNRDQNIDPRCVRALHARGIPLPGNFRPPAAVKTSDFKQNNLIVLVNGSELLHRVLRSESIDPQQLVVWGFNDVGYTSPAALFPALEAEVHLLTRRLQQVPSRDMLVKAGS